MLPAAAHGYNGTSMRRWIFFACACLGCSEPEPVDPCTWCSPPSGELTASEDTTWLVRRVRFRPVDAETDLVAGFDLDRILSPLEPEPQTCEEAVTDLVSSIDSSILGVDNAGQQLIGTAENLFGGSFEEGLDTAVQEGRLSLAIGVGAIDEEGKLELELLAVEDGQTIAVDADGFASAGQSLRVRSIASARADVRNGTAWANATTSDAIADGDAYLLPLEDFELGAIGVRAAAVPAMSAQLGGSFSVEALAQLAVEVAMGGPGDLEGVRSIFFDVSDIEPQAEDPYRCDRVSVGFELDLVEMERL